MVFLELLFYENDHVLSFMGVVLVNCCPSVSEINPMTALFYTGQLYGAVLYFYTEHRDDYIHSEYGHPIYFWFYFVFMNVLWIVIPFVLIVDAWCQLSTVQALSDRAMSQSSKRKAN